MGKELAAKLTVALTKIEWPAEERPTDQGWEAYKVGLERVDSFRDDPQVLAAALRTFQAGGSRPYAFAGVAYTLITAAREANGRFDENGLAEAMVWLEKAQATAPDITNINFIEALIYLYNGRFDDARLILDYLHQQEPNNFYVCRVEADYWHALGEATQALQWLERSIAEALTVPERMRLRRKMADWQFADKQYEAALPIYKEVSRVDTEDHLIWHKISICHWHLENYTEAGDANRRALALKDFAAGRKMEEALKEKQDAGILGRLFGR
jgi:tetratricopeptide (TPR) repeat protein